MTNFYRAVYEFGHQGEIGFERINSAFTFGMRVIFLVGYVDQDAEKFQVFTLKFN